VSRTGARLVLLEAPASPRFITMMQKSYDRHTRRMRDYARAHGIRYLNLNGTADVREADFGDYCHMTSDEGRQRYTEALAANLGPLLEETTRE
jgi:hypothetical protein